MSGLVVPLGGDGPWTGGPVTPAATCVLAGNPGPMTLDGTNTWVLRVPGEHLALVVDPVPQRRPTSRRSRRRSTALASSASCSPTGTPITPRAPRDFAARVHAPVAALDPAHRLGDEGVVDGDVVVAGGLEVAVVARRGTPPTR